MSKAISSGFLFVLMVAGLLGFAPGAGAWCFYNHTELPINYWAEDAHKDVVPSRHFDCWPGGFANKGGPRWFSIHKVSYPGDQTDAFWHVPVRVSKNGNVILSGGQNPADMTVEVTDDDGNQTYLGFLDGPHEEIKKP